MPDRTLSDGRILSLQAGEDLWALATVGENGVEAIEVEDVLGQMSTVPWFAVIGEDGRVLRRVNAAHVAVVVYDREHEPDPDGAPF